MTVVKIFGGIVLGIAIGLGYAVACDRIELAIIRRKR